ncbi:MAG: hypothetical protein ACRC8Y_05310 [Chroococcales cyanobacterium]
MKRPKDLDALYLSEMNANNSRSCFGLMGFAGLPLSISISPIFKPGISKIYKLTYGSRQNLGYNPQAGRTLPIDLPHHATCRKGKSKKEELVTNATRKN